MTSSVLAFRGCPSVSHLYPPPIATTKAHTALPFPSRSDSRMTAGRDGWAPSQAPTRQYFQQPLSVSSWHPELG